ncbi:hypothetical protein K1T73_15000 [Roseovarius sp. SCSIO 43702]|uniref:sulfotransferase family protein n=1 Tax=Roseovarius sp. SCSIO 43702 TaxID=2823043 RepID=UPI001C72C732|nr:sulfotransferase family protein [Roseovarius sp. SCSIO 43702]QYX56345.1 hypothetical protein K1T73_15000 [Roseovarius sp. SCSIO 43702]
MTLQVIGSGFGRTGTMSTKVALERLGFGPCHHMVAVMEDAAQPPLWKAFFAGGPVTPNQLYEGYGSQVDWPGAHIWPQALAAFPEAKVLHTERPEDKWWSSFDSTIGKFFRLVDDLDLPPHVADLFIMMRDGFLRKTFEDFTDRECAIAAYRRNNEAVRAAVPADRLLVFDVAEGWEPLCAFLNVPQPDEEFPRLHQKKEFWEHFGGDPEK